MLQDAVVEKAKKGQSFGDMGGMKMVVRFSPRKIAGFIPLLFAAVLAILPESHAQDIDPAVLQHLPPDQLQRVLEARRGSSAGRPALAPEEHTLGAGISRAPVLQSPSRLEQVFSERSGRPLRQFGYDTFRDAGPVVVRQTGALQDSFMLGPGDELVIDLRGQENTTHRVRIDREGRVILPRLEPIAAVGRSLGRFRDELESQVGNAYTATRAFVSVGEARQVTVFVVGEVENPGAHTLSALSTSLDALILAGGIKPTGSLRDIRVYRNGGVIPVDLYSVLTDAPGEASFSLGEGDRILVPPIGPTIAVAGSVKRPGIYELAPQERTVAIPDLVGLAGGEEMRGAFRYSAIRIRPDGREEFVDLTHQRYATLRESEVLFVEPAVDYSMGRVSLKGHVRLPGGYALEDVRSLKGLIGSREIYGDRPYLLFGVVSRRDPSTLLRSNIPFSPMQVISGANDVALADDDVVYIFSVAEARALAGSLRDREEARSRQVLGLPEQKGPLQDTTPVLPEGPSSPGPGQWPGNPSASGALEAGLTGYGMSAPGASSAAVPQSLAMASDATGAIANSSAGPLAGAGFALGSGDFARLAGDYRVSVEGAVREPGNYLVMPGTSLDQLLVAAGGPDFRADLGSIEITSTEISNEEGRARTVRSVYDVRTTPLRRISLNPLDAVRIRQVFSDRDLGKVVVTGEVRYEGAYDIIRGETLASVLERAGGLTDVAYPFGAVFTREAASATEQRGNMRSAQEIESQLIHLVGSDEVEPGEIAFLRTTADQLRRTPAIGRVSVEADPLVLRARPERDVILEPGDRIHIPRRPTSVAVTGEVLNPGSYRFDPELSPEGYLDLAGGLGQNADADRVFLLLPDGTAQRLSLSFWSYQRNMVAPGSSIVVTRDLKPLDPLNLTVDLARIMGQLAVSAASLAVIGTSN